MSRRSQYLSGVPSGVSFPKFMKPHQIAEVKRRKLLHPCRGWHELIDEVVVEATLDPLALELCSVLS